MLKCSIATLAALCTIAGAAAAQEPAAGAPKAQETQPPRSTPTQAANIRIEITITDQRSDAQAAPKTVMLLVEDNQSARLRTGRGNGVLNLDVRPQIVREGRVRLLVSLEFTPQEAPDRPPQPPISESIVALVDDGKPFVLSQSADPGSDRKVRVEVKSTILR
jgi:hypothetical protein